MGTESPLPKDHPAIVAWDDYQQTEDYSNGFRWAAHEEHRQGSMWAAFHAGFATLERDNAALRQRLADVMPLAELGALCLDRTEHFENARAPSKKQVRNLGLRDWCPTYNPALETFYSWQETDLARRARAAVKGEGL